MEEEGLLAVIVILGLVLQFSTATLVIVGGSGIVMSTLPKA